MKMFKKVIIAFILILFIFYYVSGFATANPVAVPYDPMPFIILGFLLLFIIKAFLLYHFLPSYQANILYYFTLFRMERSPDSTVMNSLVIVLLSLPRETIPDTPFGQYQGWLIRHLLNFFSQIPNIQLNVGPVTNVI